MSAHYIRTLCLLVLATVAVACQADTVERKPKEDLGSFAARHAPNRDSRVVRVSEHRNWDYPFPLILAFYEYPVALADPGKNYGSAPDDKEVFGYVFVPVSVDRYERIEVDGYGPEGTNAEIDRVSFLPRPGAPPLLQIRVGWRNNHGELVQVCAYLKPSLEQRPRKLAKVKSAKCGA